MHVVTNTGYKLILKNVRHISALKVGLLSMGVIDDSGFTSYISQGVWNLVKCLLVIIKGKKYYFLY